MENLMANWDSLGLTWMQNDIFGCIIPNETVTFRNKLISHLSGCVKIVQ